MLRNQDSNENQEAQQEALFDAIDLQQNDAAILYDAVMAVFAEHQMAVSSDFMDVLTDELAATGIASAIIADVKSLVGGQTSDKQAIEKRIQDVVLFQQNRLLQQQAQLQEEQDNIAQEAFDDVAAPIIDNAVAVAPVSVVTDIDEASNANETVMVAAEEMELEEDFIENEEDCTIPFVIAETPVVDVDLTVAADDMQVAVIALPQFETVADGVEHSVTQEQSKPHATIAQTQDDVVADAVETVAHHIDVPVSVVADVQQHDAAIVVDVEAAAENVDELIVVQAPQENIVENIVETVAVIAPQAQSFDVIAPVVMQENVENIVIDAAFEPSVNIAQVNIAQEIAPDFEQQDAARQYVDVSDDVAKIAPQIDMVADNDVMEYAAPDASEIFEEMAAPVMHLSQMDVPQIELSEDVSVFVVPQEQTQVEPQAQTEALVEADVAQNIVAEAVADIDHIIMPQMDAPHDNNVNAEQSVDGVDVVAAVAEHHAQPEIAVVENADIADDAAPLFAINPQQEGKSAALIQDNVKDVITAPDVFSLRSEPVAAVEQDDWYGDILQAQMHSFYGSLVSYGGQDAADDAPEYAQAPLQRPMKPMAA